MVAFPDSSIIDQLYLARLRAGTPIDATGLLTRFRVPLSNRPVTRQTLAPVALELPRINYESHAGKPYRYVWGAGIQVPGDFVDNIVKIDIETGRVTSWYEAGCYPGEPVFVAAPAAKAEDEGFSCRWPSTWRKVSPSCSCSMRRP